MRTEKNSFERIYEIVSQIPYGTVATYGQIAELAGNRRWARVVGYALHTADPALPCHRVVNRLGEVSRAFDTPAGNRQVVLLKAEGVTFRNGRVELAACQWRKRKY